MKYIILVGKKGELSNQDISLCSFVELTKPLSNYNRTIISYQNRLAVSINFNKVGLKAGETFEAIVLIEQQFNSRMAFLTDLYTGVVGEIKTESITDIKNIYDAFFNKFDDDLKAGNIYYKKQKQMIMKNIMNNNKEPIFDNYKNKENIKQKNISWYTRNYIGFANFEELSKFKEIFDENDV